LAFWVIAIFKTMSTTQFKQKKLFETEDNHFNNQKDQSFQITNDLMAANANELIKEI